jgi:hypothetical protein
MERPAATNGPATPSGPRGGAWRGGLATAYSQASRPGSNHGPRGTATLAGRPNQVQTGRELRVLQKSPLVKPKLTRSPSPTIHMSLTFRTWTQIKILFTFLTLSFFSTEQSKSWGGSGSADPRPG